MRCASSVPHIMEGKMSVLMLGAALGFLYNGLEGAAWGTVAGFSLLLVMVVLSD